MYFNMANIFHEYNRQLFYLTLEDTYATKTVGMSFIHFSLQVIFHC